MSSTNPCPSGEIVLEIAKSEYDNEKNRTSVIDSKTNIVITLIGVLFVAMTQIINLKRIFQFQINKFSDAIIPTLLFITILGAIIIVFIALFYFLKVIFTKTYITIDPLYFYDVEKMKYDPPIYSAAVAQFYIEATEANKIANDLRIKNYKTGMVLLIISIALFIIHTVLFSAI